MVNAKIIRAFQLCTFLSTAMSLCQAQTSSIEGLVEVSNLEAGNYVVISGGGSRGAWGAGLATHLLNDSSLSFDVAYSTSTGTYIAPLLLLEDVDALRDVYTRYKTQDITARLPFRIDRKTGDIDTSDQGSKRINLCSVLFGFLTSSSLGTSRGLLKVIERHYTPEHHQRLKDQNKRFHAVSINMHTGYAEAPSSNDVPDCSIPKRQRGISCRRKDRYTLLSGYDAMTRWMWHSGNQPLFMTHGQCNNQMYLDGGLRDIVPVVVALHDLLKKRKLIREMLLAEEIQSIETELGMEATELDALLADDSFDTLDLVGKKRLKASYEQLEFDQTEQAAHVVQQQRVERLTRLNKDPFSPSLEPSTVHIIVNNRETLETEFTLSPDPLNTLFRSIDMWSFDARYNDVEVAKLMAADNGIELVFYFMTDKAFEFYSNALEFNPSRMAKLFDASAAGQCIKVYRPEAGDCDGDPAQCYTIRPCPDF